MDWMDISNIPKIETLKHEVPDIELVKELSEVCLTSVNLSVWAMNDPSMNLGYREYGSNLIPRTPLAMF